MKKIIAIFSIILITGCAYSPMYTGKNKGDFDTVTCKADGKFCTFGNKSMQISYKVTPLPGIEYLLEGNVVFDIVVNGDLKTEMTMLFMDETKVVHEELVRMSGEHPSFSIKFRSDKEVKSASPWNLKGKIRS
jgi:hypothetical protein